jgi:type VI secretion system secreted protein Hcp
MAIYMKLDGIKGDVTEATHKDWIQLNSFQWGLGRGISSPKSSASDRESTEASISEITVSKPVDEASTNLMRAALWGRGKNATIHFTRTGDDKSQVAYMEYKLENVLLSGMSANSGGDRPTETLSLNFTKFEFQNLDSNAKNEDGQPDRVCYDMTSGVGS